MQYLPHSGECVKVINPCWGGTCCRDHLGDALFVLPSRSDFIGIHFYSNVINLRRVCTSCIQFAVDVQDSHAASVVLLLRSLLLLFFVHGLSLHWLLVFHGKSPLGYPQLVGVMASKDVSILYDLYS